MNFHKFDWNLAISSFICYNQTNGKHHFPFSIKFFERGLGKTFFKKVFPIYLPYSTNSGMNQRLSNLMEK